MMAHKIIIVFLLIAVTACQQFVCSNTWLSDGNYYDLDLCVQACADVNNDQNVTNLEQQISDCCVPVCQSQVNYHVTKRTVIIIVASILFFIVFLCCIFGCCGPSIKQKYVLFKEGQSRQVSHEGMSLQNFNRYAQQFINIASQQESKTWKISFVKQGKQIEQQKWHSIQMKLVENFKYRFQIEGQDSNGLWTSSGYFVNTARGIMIWGLKDYQNAQNTSVFFDKLSEIIYQLIHTHQGNYEGKWYFRSNPENYYKCQLKRRQLESQQKRKLHKIYNESNERIDRI